MTKEISDKNYIVILIGDIRIWLNEKEYEKLVSVIETGKMFLNAGGRIFNAKNIIYVGPRNEVDLADRVKRGEWQCSFDKWHARGEQCGHSSAFPQ